MAGVNDPGGDLEGRAQQRHAQLRQRAQAQCVLRALGEVTADELALDPDTTR
ncbi:hypothetical protein O2W14_10405 [Modestobacter sp. VKM Ac-2986]|uniref:hypothetical protein n=1 Tax=Modestobacter sp. VKM Ac-2986 TaxID=3004140 RepID=UPI0022ABB8C9|nr:hypothetical protein [Modestobacter sp. VKM Ac-2986]MCZ2829242.1 hypothetical protein [Modestobacter sp. VKM Ac-2986]